MRLPIPIRGSLQNPAPSPDGNLICLTRWRGKYNSGRADIFTYNLATHATTLLPIEGEANVSEPGSTWVEQRGIIFSTDTWGPDCAAYWDGTAVHRLFNQGDDQTWEPSWGADFYVAERHRHGRGPGQIIKDSLVEQLSGNIDELTPADQDCRQPCVSPDSTMVIYQRHTGNDWHLMLLDLASRKHSTVASGTDATFSHDSRKVVFSSNAGRLLVYDFVRKTLSPVQVETRYSGAPSFSRNDKHIYYEGGPSGDDGGPPTSIYVADVP